MGYFDNTFDDGPTEPGYDFESTVLVEGDSQTFPTITDPGQRASGGAFTGLANLLGSIGTTARNVGTAVGSVQRDVRLAPQQYEAARQQAASGNRVGQWWNYSTGADKMTILIGLAGLGLVVYYNTRK